jgi:hypothetical protein
MSKQNPYSSKAKRAFWRSAVADVHYADLFDLWQPIKLTPRDRIATAGSCFAQHIGNSLAARGANYIDMEPAPPIFSNINDSRRFGYGVFSCRYGNIYTSRQLIQLFDEAHGNRNPIEPIWKKGDRFFDALRPRVDPVGQDSSATVLALRKQHLSRVREMFATLDVFVFTMGLTEGWEARADGTMYPMAPGTVAGSYDPDRYAFRNLRCREVLEDMIGFRERLKLVNSSAQILLTVSPIPLVATASENHVLVATTYSKSVLRAVAGELTDNFADVHYFPSYEIIACHPSRGFFFDPDLRSVNTFGVDYVMKHFFSGALASIFASDGSVPEETLNIMCDEEALSNGEEFK